MIQNIIMLMLPMICLIVGVVLGYGLRVQRERLDGWTPPK